MPDTEPVTTPDFSLALRADEIILMRRLLSNARFDTNMSGFDQDTIREIASRLPAPENDPPSA